MKYTYYGDADLSGHVDGTDYSLIDAHSGLSSGATWSEGDFNYDGAVNGSDYSLIDNAYNMQGMTSPASPNTIIANATAEDETDPLYGELLVVKADNEFLLFCSRKLVEQVEEVLMPRINHTSTHQHKTLDFFQGLFF